jgi:hypothetical protein
LSEHHPVAVVQPSPDGGGDDGGAGLVHFDVDPVGGRGVFGEVVCDWAVAGGRTGVIVGALVWTAAGESVWTYM